MGRPHANAGTEEGEAHGHGARCELQRCGRLAVAEPRQMGANMPERTMMNTGLIDCTEGADLEPTDGPVKARCRSRSEDRGPPLVERPERDAGHEKRNERVSNPRLQEPAAATRTQGAEPAAAGAVPADDRCVTGLINLSNLALLIIVAVVAAAVSCFSVIISSPPECDEAGRHAHAARPKPQWKPAFSWSKATDVGQELIGAGTPILSGDGRGFPLDDDELERWTRVGL